MADLILERLLGHHVRVTNPDNQSAWEGWLVSLSDQPSLVIEQNDGWRVTLPQSFTVARTGRIASAVASDHAAPPRPENVVKATALREAAADRRLTNVTARQVMHEMANDLDPPIQSGCAACPAEPTGDLAVVRVGGGEVWVRRTIADARRWVASEPWIGSGPLAAETWDALCESYGPITVLSDGVGESS